MPAHGTKPEDVSVEIKNYTQKMLIILGHSLNMGDKKIQMTLMLSSVGCGKMEAVEKENCRPA